MGESSTKYVSRGGLKLEAALAQFTLNPTGWICADLGSNVGGFVDCLLQRGAAKVYAIETGYGVLAWKLRCDPRVVVMERTNALHVTLPEKVDLVTIDVGWTRQRYILTAASRMLRHRAQVLTLVKPHYEAAPNLLRRGVLPEQRLDEVLTQVRQTVISLGWQIQGDYLSPLLGQAGNREAWLLLTRSSTGSSDCD